MLSQNSRRFLYLIFAIGIVDVLLLITAIISDSQRELYNVVRLCMFVSGIFLGYVFYENKKILFAILWVAAAIIYNPFVRVMMTKADWNNVDFITAILVIASMYYYLPLLKQSIKMPTVSKDKKTVDRPSKNVINKIALALVLTTAFIHFLMMANKGHKGAFDTDDMFVFFNGSVCIVPIYWINGFYCVYFLYILLTILGVLKIEVRNFIK